MVAASRIPALAAAICIATGVRAFDTYKTPDGVEIIAEMPYHVNNFTYGDGSYHYVYTLSADQIYLNSTWLYENGPVKACNGKDEKQYSMEIVGRGNDPDKEHCQILKDWAKQDDAYFSPTAAELNEGKGALMGAFYKTCGWAIQYDHGGEPMTMEHDEFFGNLDIAENVEQAIVEAETTNASSVEIKEKCDAGRWFRSYVFNAGAYPHIDLTDILDEPLSKPAY